MLRLSWHSEYGKWITADSTSRPITPPFLFIRVRGNTGVLESARYYTFNYSGFALLWDRKYESLSETIYYTFRHYRTPPPHLPLKPTALTPPHYHFPPSKGNPPNDPTRVRAVRIFETLSTSWRKQLQLR